MVAPLVAAAAVGKIAGGVALGTVVGGLISAPLGATWGASWTPTQRRSSYNANLGDPNLLLDPTSAIQLYHAGTISLRDLDAHMRRQGMPVQLPAHPLNPYLHLRWNQVVNQRRPHLSIDVLRAAHYLSRVPDGVSIAREFNRHGLAGWPSRRLWWAPPYAAEPARVVEQWHLGNPAYAEARAHLAAGGMVDQADQDRLASEFRPLDLTDLIALYNRGVIDRGVSLSHLRAQGYRGPEQAEKMLRLAELIPGPSDLVRMSIRDVWSREIVERFGYDAEWPEQAEFRFWMAAQGLAASAEIPGGAPGAPETWAQAYWRAHWDLPSPTQVYTMLHRLRPDSQARWPAEYRGAQPVDIADVRLLLRTADYPPIWRDRLAAISYSLPPLRTMRRIIDTAVTLPGVGAVLYPGPGWAAADAAEEAGDLPGARAARAGLLRQGLQDFYRDRGLTQDTARVFTEHDLIQARIGGSETEPRRLDRLVRRWAEAVLRRFRLGLLGRADAEASLAEVGWGPQSRRIALDLESSTRDEQLVRAGVARLRGDYNAGRLSLAQVRDRLRQVGIAEGAVAAYAGRWQAARTEPIRRLETGAILRAVAEGLLAPVLAQARLENLGWSRPDGLLLLAGAAGRLRQRSASALRADLLSRDKAARALAKQSRDAAAQTRRLQQRVRQLTPPSKLIRWFAHGRISEQYLRRRLADMGDPPEVIALTLAEAEQAAAAEAKRERPRKREVREVTTAGGETTKTVTKTREDTSGPVTRIHVEKRSERE